MNFSRIKVSLVLFLVSISIQGQNLPTDGPLTINSKVQELAEKLLKNKQGSIVAIDPTTGEILCMVSKNKVQDNINRAISVDYSPGSTFKVAQAATLLSLRALVPEQEYNCKKGFWQEKIHIGCHDHKAPLKLVQAIGQSCNSYFCKAFKEFIDNRTLYPSKITTINTWNKYMLSMGLGNPLGIDMPGEIGGLIPDATYLNTTHKGSWNGTTIMWVGMGQGEVNTTPLQLCNLAAVIANRGFFYTPHIHKPTPEHPLDSSYTTKRISLPEPSAFEKVIEGMRAAVINGTCVSIRNPNYKVCGKTGTAENKGHDHSVFMGFAPMDNPKIAVSVYVENGGWGADLAAPLGGLIMEQYILGQLSPTSQKVAKKWENKEIYITPVEIPFNFDDL